MTDLTIFIRKRVNQAWAHQIDADFTHDGRLRGVVEVVRADLRTGRLG